MSSALVLAASTAILRHLLENGLVERGVTETLGGDVQVTAQAPDRVKAGAEERPQLNLFLYHVETRGINPASRYAPEDAQPGTPLVLELHYLMTAYGAQDFHTEVLLGCGMELLHRNPILRNPAVRRILAAISAPEDGRTVPPPLASLGASALPEQMDELRIWANEMSHENMANLWSSLQTPYRPTRSYKVTVTLTDGFGGQQER